VKHSKFFALFVSLVFLSEFFVLFGQEPIDAPVEKVFIPAGYDDNDGVEVMIHGEFANGCYRLGKVDVVNPENEGDPYIVHVKANLYKPEEGVFCIQATIPYLKPVNLGIMKQGIHELVVNPGPKEVRKTIVIGKRTTDAPDNADYAPVDRGEIVKERLSPTGQSLVLQGRYPMMLKGCVEITEVRQNRDAEDLLTVLPIMTMYRDERCASIENQFKIKVHLEIPFDVEGLLHVRKIDGASYNTMIVPQN
jgi:hypothetical protein